MKILMSTMSLQELIGKKVSVRTGIATLRDIKGTIEGATETLIKLRDESDNVLYIPLGNCGFIKEES